MFISSRKLLPVTVALIVVPLLSNVESRGQDLVRVADFDDGSFQGWTAGIDEVPFNGDLFHKPTGGNPGGHLVATDTVGGGGCLPVFGPSMVKGDLSVYEGLQWDELVFDNGRSTLVATGVGLIGEDGTEYHSIKLLQVIGAWHTKSVTFQDATFWQRRAGCAPFESVVKNVAEFFMCMDTSNQANMIEESGIDNIFLVPLVPRRIFQTYNDFSWNEGQLTENITRYTTDSGPGDPPDGSSGFLIDYESGEQTSVALSVEGGHWNGENHVATHGALSRPGTDAYEIFNGIVDASGVLSYPGARAVVLSFSGLDPSFEYEVVLFSNRDRPDYTDRLTRYTVCGVEGLTNESSLGATFMDASDESTTVPGGYNTENGFVARFTGLKSGCDGRFSVIVSDGGSTKPDKHYLNAMRLRWTAGFENEESLSSAELSY